MYSLARLSVGAQADSTHEYLLKQYLLTAKTDKVNLELCKYAVYAVSAVPEPS
jgi:Glycosyl hydrolase family 47